MPLRFFTLFSKKSNAEEDEESIQTTSSSTTEWYYCQDCKIGFASQIRLHWHTDLCKKLPC